MIPQQTASYSITSSARASSVGGKIRLRRFALLRLIFRATAVACSTGRSEGREKHHTAFFLRLQERIGNIGARGRWRQMHNQVKLLWFGKADAFIFRPLYRGPS